MSEKLEENENPYEKIILKEESGLYYDPRGIPVYYDISCGEERLVGDFNLSETQPAYFSINSSDNLWIFLHRSVPRKFVDVVFFHELKEVEFIQNGENDSNAHKLAVQEETRYLEANFTREEIEEFRAWEATIRKI